MVPLGRNPVGCVEDGFEENDASERPQWSPRARATRRCSGDDDWFSVLADGRPLAITISFTHANGDLDLEGTDAAGVVIDASAGTSDSETVTLTTVSGRRYLVHVYGYRGAGVPTVTVASG